MSASNLVAELDVQLVGYSVARLEIGVVASMGVWKDCAMVRAKVVSMVEKLVFGMDALKAGN